MLNRQNILTFGFALGLTGTHAVSQTALLGSDERSALVECRITAVTPVRTQHGVVNLEVVGGSVVNQIGSPELPVIYLNIAVPPSMVAAPRVITRESGTIWDGKLPVCNPGSSESEPPANLAAVPINETIGEIDYQTLGGLKVARIPVYPARISSSPDRVELARRIVLRVDFAAGPSEGARRWQVMDMPVRVNRLARLAVLNAEQAAGWGRVQTSNFRGYGWPQGFLFKFTVDDEGLYRLTFGDLKDRGVDLPDGGLRSDQIKLFGNGGYELPLEPDGEAPLGLEECAIHIEDGGDGLFGAGDWVAFYGRDAGGWTADATVGWRYSVNHYAFKNTYWLNIDPSGGGKRMSGFDESLPAVDQVAEAAQMAVHIEPERFIYGRSDFIGTGREWYAYTFDGLSRLSYTVQAQRPDPSLPASLRLRVVNASRNYSSRINVYVNDELLYGFNPQDYNQPGEVVIDDVSGHLVDGNNRVTLEQVRSSGRALFDWLTLTYHGALEGERTFTGIDFEGSVQYRFSNSPNLWIFDVTDHSSVRRERSDEFTVRQTGANPRRYLALDETRFRLVTSSFEEYFPVEGDIDDLWSESNRADVLVITPDAYWDASQPLLDFYSRRNPPLAGKRVRLSEIYNRFSGGQRDPAAIRNLLLFATERWAKAPDYALFCGDGDYNYRDIDRPEWRDALPPYESGGICSDDWFSDFTPYSEDVNIEPLPEIIHARLTGQSAGQISAMVEKIIAYDENPEWGAWRNRVTMVADDEFGESSVQESGHVRGSEDIISNDLPRHIETVKIYLTEYPRQFGREKPQAGIDLVESINRGSLIVNYMGHGNPTLWAHEHVFVQSRDLVMIEPSRRLPLYIAFTCDWAYWDDPASQSFPEQLMAMADGGAVGVIASTRLTYEFSNTRLAKRYFRDQFSIEGLSIAEALKLGKWQESGINSATYHLLGEPTLRLGNPKLGGRFDALGPTPLVPLGVSGVEGVVFDAGGDVNTNFNGELDFLVMDTQVLRTYVIYNRYHEPYTTLTYYLSGPAIYRGLLSVGAGGFAGRFIVPRDATLGGAMGGVKAYYHDAEIDGIIARDSLAYAVDYAAADDDEPPVMQIYFDHRSHRRGDRVGSNPILIADITDSSGLNLTGALGHGINLSIDGGASLNLTSFFRYNMDSYQSGSLERQIGPLDAGFHTLELQAWDNFNNLAIIETEIEVVEGAGGLIVDRVLNWPNPFRETSQLTFTVNRAADFEIQVYTVGGRLIWRYNGYATTAGINGDAVWDGRDHAGRRCANGVYLYKVIARDDSGNRAEGLGRIAYIR